ncbi:MAG: hypothetical protein R6W81_13205 [Bacteroidales bacterium]
MKTSKSPINRSKNLLHKSYLLIFISVFFFSFSADLNTAAGSLNSRDTEGEELIELNLRIHIMTDVTMTHSSGLVMDNWVSPRDIEEIIMPEVNAIWSQANIKWVIESIIKENAVKGESYEESIAFIASTKRDSAGHSDSARLPHLYSLMQPKNMSTPEELDENLFHIYLFPFIGNTSQGNAMRPFNWSTVVGTWTNKFNRGGTPEKVLLTEDHDSFKRGSLSRTIAHEIGHVLNLKHNECETDCLMGGKSQGYLLTEGQIATARLEALKRINKQ